MARARWECVPALSRPSLRSSEPSRHSAYKAECRRYERDHIGLATTRAHGGQESDMPRLRTWAILLGGASAALMVLHHARDSAGLETPGGIVMRDAAGYDLLSGVLLGSFYDSVAADVGAAAPPSGRVLDVGCGPGHLANRLARDHGLRVTGLDLDPAMIERARANAAHAVPAERRPTFVVSGVAVLPFPDASFDVVVSTLSMHHWADPTAGQAEIGRVLRPGGRALVWDIRPGIVPLHGHRPDPLDSIADSPLHLASAMPWRWPWRLTFTQRIELVAADGQAGSAGTERLGRPPTNG
jgi:SAM-dependent methyltransferase